MAVKWARHKALSVDDMFTLNGTTLMVQLQSTRLIIIYEPNDKHATFDDMNLYGCSGVFHHRRLEDRADTLEILFELEADRDMVEQTLTQWKMGES